MAAENSINYALRILKPVLNSPEGVVELCEDAEKRYVDRIQDDLAKTVWNSGCQSWYIQTSAKANRTWNAMSYPYSQAYFWYRSLFPVWGDWKIAVSPGPEGHLPLYSFILKLIPSGQGGNTSTKASLFVQLIRTVFLITGGSFLFISFYLSWRYQGDIKAYGPMILKDLLHI